jgi:uncharacterized protein YcbX
MKVSSLHIYPVKSLGGFSANEWKLEARGLEHDRRWMLVDESGFFLTQRTLPELCLLEAVIQGKSLVIRDRKERQEDLILPVAAPSGENLREVQVWNDIVPALYIEPEQVSAWFSTLFGRSIYLAYMPEQSERPVDPQYAQAGDMVSFADGYPVLIALEASLEDLNARLAEPVGMERFRPNLVVEGGKPWEEDSWRAVAVGEAHFRTPKPCARCKVITIDPANAEVGVEPMRTLSAFHKQGNKTLFGMNACWEKQSGPIVRVGDSVAVLKQDIEHH